MIDQRDLSFALYYIGYLVDQEGWSKWRTIEKQHGYLDGQSEYPAKTDQGDLQTKLTKVETTWNRRILRQLYVKLISLNHSVYSLQAETGTLQIDRNFILSMLQIWSQLSTLLVSIIQLNKDLGEIYNYMTTLSSNVLSPSIISPVDLRQLLIKVKQDLIGHPKLGLPSNYEGKGIWDYYRLLKIKSLVYKDALFVIVSVPLIGKSQTVTMYKIHILSILVPDLHKQFSYNIPNDFIAITTNGLYIMYPDSNEILSSQLSAGQICINSSAITYLMIS